MQLAIDVHPETEAPSAFLSVRDLRVHFPTADGLVMAVDGLSFTLDRGRTLGIVGESGSGKSVTSLGIMGLHHGGNATIDGNIWLDGEDLVGASPASVENPLDPATPSQLDAPCGLPL